MTATPAPAATLAVGQGMNVQIHAHGRIVAAAVRHGRGWAVSVDGQTHQAATLDGVLALLGLLPQHHRS